MKVNSIEILRQLVRDQQTKIENLENELRLAKKSKAKIEKEIAKQVLHNARVTTVQANYNADLPWKRKIYYVLNKTNGATLEEVIEEVIKHEPKLEPNDIYQTVKRTMIRLVNEMIVIKIGKYKSTYKLNAKKQS